MQKHLSHGIIALAIASLVGCDSDDHSGPDNPPVVGAPGVLLVENCEGDTCEHSNTVVFAVSHAFVDPDNTVYYRVTVPAWSTGTDWGDGTNGFFYQTTVDGTSTSTYIPFNGMSVGTDGRPMMPQFSFIVEADVSAGEENATLVVDACATNHEGDASTTECAEILWTDTYAGLPTPAVGLGPSGDPFNVLQAPNVLFDASTGSSATTPNNGVAPVVLLVCPTSPGGSACASENTYTDEQLQWFYDHLVFFDLGGKPYTNDIFADSAQHRSMGVLTIDEAAYAVSGTDFRTRYGSPSTFGREADPERQFFFYTRNGSATAITVGVQYLYDADDCNGNLNQVGCGSSTVTGTVSVMPAAAISPLTQSIGGVEAFPANSNSPAGVARTRTITFESTGQSSLCRNAVNPLAASGGNRPANLPNYVIERRLGNGNWKPTFGPAMYYVLPTGFGNCYGAGTVDSAAPFCDRVSGYIGYVPHYTDISGNSGTLNGGSTDEALVESLTLADQYNVGDVSQTGANALVWFDNCGYGYTYEECTSSSGVSCSHPLGPRKSLPKSLPNDRKEIIYSVTNDFPQAVVLGKECCASFYQKNSQTENYEPPSQIDDRFGIFVGGPQSDGAGGTRASSLSYATIFEKELMVVYDAASGLRLFKTEFGASEPALYRCSDRSATLEVDTGSSPVTVTLGGSGSSAVGCEPFPDCPLGTTAGMDGDHVTCTTEVSNFVMGIEDWTDEHLFGISSVQVRAWGGKGQKGGDNGAGGGGPGFALTVLRPTDLPRAFYPYVGNQQESTVVSKVSLLSLSGQVDFTDIPTDGGSIVLIAGGGGKGGDNSSICKSESAGPTSGAGGAQSIANADPSGPFMSNAGGDAHEVTDGASGGKGGNKDGLGAGGDPGSGGGDKGGSGLDGVGGGNWNRNGSLIVPKSWSFGHGGGGHETGGSGGGGFGGGGGGTGDVCGSGGGGGGSWATGNTVHDPEAPKGRPSSPSDNGVFEIVYLPDPLETCTLISQPRPAVRCTFTTSETPLDFSTSTGPIVVPTVLDEVSLVAQLGDLPLDEIPVSVEAWGGRGGNGGDALFEVEGGETAKGGKTGIGGYARSSHTVASLRDGFSDNLYFYVGDNGTFPTGRSDCCADPLYSNPGGGGAATLVLSAELTGQTQMDDVLLIAGGGGGGGQGAVIAFVPYKGTAGIEGPAAIATTAMDVSATAVSKQDNSGGDGTGACRTVSRNNISCGGDGIGGMGGSQGAGRAGWVGLSLQLKQGQGAGTSGGGAGGGAAGGGFGGGVDGEVKGVAGGAQGGGAGGSWARQATFDDTDMPVLGQDNPPTDTQGAVALTFDVCAVYPEEFSCD